MAHKRKSRKSAKSKRKSTTRRAKSTTKKRAKSNNDWFLAWFEATPRKKSAKKSHRKLSAKKR